jgi:hypothetical protein
MGKFYNELKLAHSWESEDSQIIYDLIPDATN